MKSQVQLILKLTMYGINQEEGLNQEMKVLTVSILLKHYLILIDWVKNIIERKYQTSGILDSEVGSRYLISELHMSYTMIITYTYSFGVNQGNHQNFNPPFLHYKCWMILMGMNQKKSKWPTLKNGDFQNYQLSKKFVKISRIDPS